MNIDWDEPSDNGGADIEGYRVYRRMGENNYTMISELLPSESTCADDDIVFGSNYTYYVVAFNREGDGDRSLLLNITPLTPPGPPINLTCTRGTLHNNVSWYPPVSTGGSPIIGYHVYFSEDNSSFNLLGSTNGTYFVHPVDEAGKVYYYHVKAENEVGIGPMSITVPSLPVGPPLGRPIVTVSIQNASIVFSMEPPYDNGGGPITHYVIKRDGSLLEEVPFETAYYNDTPLVNGEVHTYEIYAVNMAGNSEVTGPMDLASSRTPYCPRNLTAVAKGGHIILSWDPPDDDGGMPIQGYSVYRWMEDGWEGTGWHRMMILNDTSWTDTLVDEGAIYRYYVVALNNRGAGDKSRVITINNTELLVPSSPGNVKGYLTDNGISITWDEPEFEGTSPVTGYNVFRKVGASDDFVLIGSTPVTSFLNTNISSFTTYHYYIVAVSDTGSGNNSEIVTVEVGDLSEIPSIDNGTVKFPWAIVVSVLISVLFIFCIIVIWMVMKGRSGDEDVSDDEEGTSVLDEIESVVVNGQDTDITEEPSDWYVESPLDGNHENIVEDPPEDHPEEDIGSDVPGMDTVDNMDFNQK